MTRSRGTHGLRRRCPRCGHLRRFYEPPAGQGGRRPARAKWAKVGEIWVCRACVDRERRELYADPRVAALVQAGIESARRDPLVPLEDLLAELGLLDPTTSALPPQKVIREVLAAFNQERGGCAKITALRNALRGEIQWGLMVTTAHDKNYSYMLEPTLAQVRHRPYPCRVLHPMNPRVLPNETTLRAFLDETLRGPEVSRVLARLEGDVISPGTKRRPR